MPNKKIFGLVIGMLILWEGAKTIPKAWALRHASEDTGLKGEAFKAAAVVF